MNGIFYNLVSRKGDILKLFPSIALAKTIAGLAISACWLSVAQATDSRCPPGMHSDDGVACYPGDGTYDQDQIMNSVPPGFRQPMEHRDILWSAFAMDKERLLVTDKEMKFVGASRKQKSMKDAQKVALDMCKSDGSNNCKVIETVINSCLAISISPEANKLEYVFNADMQSAIEQSMRKCNQQYKGCKSAYADCFMQ